MDKAFLGVREINTSKSTEFKPKCMSDLHQFECVFLKSFARHGDKPTVKEKKTFLMLYMRNVLLDEFSLMLFKQSRILHGSNQRRVGRVLSSIENAL